MRGRSASRRARAARLRHAARRRARLARSGELKHKLRDPTIRARLERERIEGAGKPEFPEWLGWGRVVFERVQKENLKPLEGKSVEEIARATGKAPMDAFCDTLLEDELAS